MIKQNKVTEYLPFIWSGMAFLIVAAAVFLPIDSDKMTLVANTTSGLFGAAFGAATLNKEESEENRNSK